MELTVFRPRQLLYVQVQKLPPINIDYSPQNVTNSKLFNKQETTVQGIKYEPRFPIENDENLTF